MPVTQTTTIGALLGELGEDARLEEVIARRNIAWARWQDALVLLAIYRDELGFDDVQVRAAIGQVNDTQSRYEWAARQLVQARVWWRSSRTAA